MPSMPLGQALSEARIAQWFAKKKNYYERKVENRRKYQRQYQKRKKLGLVGRKGMQLSVQVEHQKLRDLAKLWDSQKIEIAR